MPSVALAAVAAGALFALAPRPFLAGTVGLAIALAVVLRPPVAAYLLVFVTPLVVGMDRDLILPILRPNELLLLLTGCALIGRWLARVTTGEPMRWRVTRLDAVIVFLASASSVLPLLWMVLRGKPVSQDDILYALAVWKLFAVYVIVKATIRTEQQVRTCLWLSTGAAAIVAVIAVLQSLLLFGVADMLARFYSPLGDEALLYFNRGTSTLSSSVSTGDLMAFNFAIAMAMLIRREQRRTLVMGAAVLFTFGALASGQFSTVIGLLVVVGAVGLLSGNLTRRMLTALPTAIVAAILLQPVIQRRLSGFRSPGGLPPSWRARLENLQRFFWPELFSNFNFVLGVRPAARVPAPEPWRKFVFIESGHTWLLWIGGIPLFAAFVLFVWTGLRTTWTIARERMDAVGIAAMASFAALAAITVLMTFDPHLTLRGSADLAFALLALASVKALPQRTDATRPGRAEPAMAAR